MTPLLPERNPEAHKGQQGRCLVIGGGPQMLGAPILAAKAALRAGVGLMDAVTAASAEGWLEALPEAMVLSPDLISAEDLALRYQSVVCGPGALHFEPMESWIKNVLASNVPTVFDASALDCFSLSSKNRSGSISPPLKPQHVCTPHPGEAARILDCSTQEVESDRVAALNALIERLQCTVVLKGAHTLIGNCEGQRALSPFRNAVLAVPGSGDVLAGMIGAYLARGLSAFPAACLGVYLHARTGETWAARKGTVEGMLASDLADLLPEVVGQLELAERTHES